MRFLWMVLLAFALGCGGSDDGDSDADTDTDVDTDVDTDTDTDTGSDPCDDRYFGAPLPRADHVSVFDANRQEIVVWGGDVGVPSECIPQPQYVNELWVYELDCNTWREVEDAGGPEPRARSVAIHDEDRNRLLVFGGRSQLGGGNYALYNDLWALDLETLTFSEVATSGTPPSPRANTTAVHDATRNRMIVFGGNASTMGVAFTPLDDTFALNLETHEWTEIATEGDVPEARLFHAATLSPDGDTMIVYSGGDEDAYIGPFLNDLWALDLTTDTWTELTMPAVRPLPRINGLLRTDADRLILFAGHDDGALGNRNDLWDLDLAGPTWTLLGAGDELNANPAGFCDFPPDFATIDMSFPERRSGATLAPDGEGGAYLFGGKTDCGVVNGVWRLDYETESFAELRVSTQGLACERAGGVACTTHCY